MRTARPQAWGPRSSCSPSAIATSSPRLAERAGWLAIAARRADNAESRFIASGASVAVVDARGALPEGKEAVRGLADPAEANAAALLVLLSRGDADALDALYAARRHPFPGQPVQRRPVPPGAAICPSPRRAGRRPPAAAPRRAGRATGKPGTASWRWQPGSQTVELSPALARKAGLGEEAGQRISLMELFRKLDPDGRKAARGAIDRLLATGQSTAFAHQDGEGDGARLAHHVRVEGRRTGLVGRTEAIVPLEGAGLAVARPDDRGSRRPRRPRLDPAGSSRRKARASRPWSCCCSR